MTENNNKTPRCEITVRRPNGTVEVIVNPKIPYMTEYLWKRCVKLNREAGNGEYLSYKNIPAAPPVKPEPPKATIFLSMRGWGDYSNLEWRGDINRPDADILAECRHLLETGHDVDDPNQSDADILAKIAEAREKIAAPVPAETTETCKCDRCGKEISAASAHTHTVTWSNGWRIQESYCDACHALKKAMRG